VRGIAAVLLWTGLTLEILTYLFGAMALIYGVMLVVFGSTQPVGRTGTTLAMLPGISGALSVVIGGLVFVALYLGVFAIACGIISIITGISLRGEKTGAQKTFFSD